MLITEVLRGLSRSKFAALLTTAAIGIGDSNWGREIGKMMGRAAAQEIHDRNMSRNKKRINSKAALIAHIIKSKRRGNQQ